MAVLSRRALLSAAAVLPLSAPALASAWRPDRPVELVVGFAAGGGTDVVARLFARFLEPRLGGPVVVVNRPGAGGELALAQVARARPDGHVLGVTNMPAFVSIPVERRAQYSLDQFAFVAGVMTDPTGLVVRGDGPATLEAFLAGARRDEAMVSTSGVGTDDHLLLAMLGRHAGARIQPVHFTGAPLQRTALMGRQVEGATMSVGEMAPEPAGVRMLAHGGRTRSRFLPDVPTFRELGLPIEMSSERGIVAPAGLPAPVLERLRAAIEEACADPAAAAAFAAQAIEPGHEPGPAWEARMRQAQETYAALWREAPWRG